MHAVINRKDLKVVDTIADTQAGLAEVDRVDILQEDEEFIQLTITMYLANLIVALKAICWPMRVLNIINLHLKIIIFYHKMKTT